MGDLCEVVSFYMNDKDGGVTFVLSNDEYIRLGNNEYEKLKEQGDCKESYLGTKGNHYSRVKVQGRLKFKQLN